MRKAFVIVSALLLVAFALQFVFAAVGAFTKPAGDDAYALHSVNGMAVIPVLTLLTIAVRRAGEGAGPAHRAGDPAARPRRPPGAHRHARRTRPPTPSGVSTPLGLTIGGLHALNGIIAVHVVVGVHRAARKLADPAPADATGWPSGKGSRHDHRLAARGRPRDRGPRGRRLAGRRRRVGRPAPPARTGTGRLRAARHARPRDHDHRARPRRLVVRGGEGPHRRPAVARGGGRRRAAAAAGPGRHPVRRGPAPLRRVRRRAAPCS